MCTNADFLDFVTHIRHKTPTSLYLASKFASRTVSYVTRFDTCLNVNVTICNHIEDTLEYNMHCLRHKFSLDDIFVASCNTKVEDDHPLAMWRNDVIKNNCISHLTIGANVIITTNISNYLVKNGDFGAIQSIKKINNKQDISRVDVFIPRIEGIVSFRISLYFYNVHLGDIFHVSTFPFLLS